MAKKKKEVKEVLDEVPFLEITEDQPPVLSAEDLPKPKTAWPDEDDNKNALAPTPALGSDKALVTRRYRAADGWLLTVFSSEFPKTDVTNLKLAGISVSLVRRRFPYRIGGVEGSALVLFLDDKKNPFKGSALYVLSWENKG